MQVGGIRYPVGGGSDARSSNVAAVRRSPLKRFACALAALGSGLNSAIRSDRKNSLSGEHWRKERNVSVNSGKGLFGKADLQGVRDTINRHQLSKEERWLCETIEGCQTLEELSKELHSRFDSDNTIAKFPLPDAVIKSMVDFLLDRSKMEFVFQGMRNFLIERLKVKLGDNSLKPNGRFNVGELLCFIDGLEKDVTEKITETETRLCEMIENCESLGSLSEKLLEKLAEDKSVAECDLSDAVIESMVSFLLRCVELRDVSSDHLLELTFSVISSGKKRINVIKLADLIVQLYEKANDIACARRMVEWNNHRNNHRRVSGALKVYFDGERGSDEDDLLNGERAVSSIVGQFSGPSVERQELSEQDEKWLREMITNCDSLDSLSKGLHTKLAEDGSIAKCDLSDAVIESMRKFFEDHLANELSADNEDDADTKEAYDQILKLIGTVNNGRINVSELANLIVQLNRKTYEIAIARVMVERNNRRRVSGAESGAGASRFDRASSVWSRAGEEFGIVVDDWDSDEEDGQDGPNVTAAPASGLEGKKHFLPAEFVVKTEVIEDTSDGAGDEEDVQYGPSVTEDRSAVLKRGSASECEKRDEVVASDKVKQVTGAKVRA